MIERVTLVYINTGLIIEEIIIITDRVVQYKQT